MSNGVDNVNIVQEAPAANRIQPSVSTIDHIEWFSAHNDSVRVSGIWVDENNGSAPILGDCEFIRCWIKIHTFGRSSIHQGETFYQLKAHAIDNIYLVAS